MTDNFVVPIEVAHDKETEADMKAISILANAATKEGLLVEAIWSYGQSMSSKDNVQEAVEFAFNEWDI